MGEWGTLDGGTAPVAESPGRADPRPAATTTSWGALDGRSPAESPATAAVPRHRRPPPPEVIGSLLRTGETVWARIERTGATLGSGQLLTLTAAPPDGVFGWRPVLIVDAARMLAEVIPVPQAVPAEGIGDAPAALYRPTEPQPAGIARAAGFPVGAGPDLRALLDREVDDLRQHYERELAELRRRATYEQRDLQMRIERLQAEVEQLQETNRRRRPGLFGRGDS